MKAPQNKFWKDWKTRLEISENLRGETVTFPKPTPCTGGLPPLTMTLNW